MLPYCEMAHKDILNQKIKYQNEWGMFQWEKDIYHLPLHHPTLIRQKEMDLPMEIEIKICVQ